MALPANEFQSAKYDKGTLAVARNHVGYNEDSTLSVMVYDESGRIVSNLSFDHGQAKELAELLVEISLKNEELKPKEKSEREQIEALRVGVVFSIVGPQFVRGYDDKVRGLKSGITYRLASFSETETGPITILYDPNA